MLAGDSQTANSPGYLKFADAVLKRLAKMSKRTLKTLTLAEKKTLIEELSKDAKNSAIAVKYDLPRSTVSTIWKNKDKILKDFESSECDGKKRRVRQCIFEDVDKAVSTWFHSVRKQNLPVSGPIN